MGLPIARDVIKKYLASLSPLAEKYNKRLWTPPKTGAVLRKESGYEKRNEAIQIINGLVLIGLPDSLSHAIA
jgi:hypothetical protein